MASSDVLEGLDGECASTSARTNGDCGDVAAINWLESSEDDLPRPKWWLLHATNYLVMGVFVSSVIYHVRNSASMGPRFQRDASSLLPMLLLWSLCMAYFFGFFGISFVDKDEDLLVVYDGGGAASVETRSLEEWRRELAGQSALRREPVQPMRNRGRLAPVPEEETDNVDQQEEVRSVPPRATAPQAPPDSPSWGEVIGRVRNEKDAARAALVLERATSRNIARPVGPLLIGRTEAVVPLAAVSPEVRQLADTGMRALRLSGGVKTTTTPRRPTRTLASCCVTTTGAAEAAALCDAADNAQVGAVAVGRCVFVELNTNVEPKSIRSAARDLASRLSREAGAKGAFASAVTISRPSRQSIVVAEATLPGPIVKRVLGASVADLCAADVRARLAVEANRAKPDRVLDAWTDRAHAADVVDALASAVGEPLPSTTAIGRLVVEAVNCGRDLHVSLAAPARGRPICPKAGSLLELVHDISDFDMPHKPTSTKLCLDTVLAAIVLSVELANLAQSALHVSARARCG